jgi:hypothetical protein
MVATVAGIHLGIDTHANRPAANAVPDGSQYSCSDHGLIYKSNFAGNSWATWATLGITSVAGGDHGTLTGLSDDDHPQYLLESLLDAKGDLIGATAADTPARVPVGANGSSLRANSGASTGFEWQLNKLDATAAPAVTDDSGDGYSVGSVWIDVTGDDAYICVDATAGAAVWIPFDSAGGESWEGAWSAGSYTTGQIVVHNDVVYQANTTTSDEPPSADWDVLYTAPAGGGPLLYVDDITLHADGSECDDTGMTGWTITNATIAAVTTEPYDDTCLEFTFPAAGDRVMRALPAGTDYEATYTLYGITNATPNPATAGQAAMGLCLVDGSGNGIVAVSYNDGWRLWTITTYAIAASIVFIAWPPGYPTASGMATAIKLKRVGSTATLSIGVNGGTLFATGTGANSTTFTQWGLLRANSGGGTSPRIIVGRINLEVIS